jgi:hypothetical protein
MNYLDIDVLLQAVAVQKTSRLMAEGQSVCVSHSSCFICGLSMTDFLGTPANTTREHLQIVYIYLYSMF